MESTLLFLSKELSTASLRLVLFEKINQNLQSIISYDLILVPKRVKFSEVFKSGGGFCVSNKPSFSFKKWKFKKVTSYCSSPQSGDQSYQVLCLYAQ